jgi:phosphonate transport system substrate-binding protein
LTTAEFLKLDPALIGNIFVGLRDGEAEEVYVILIRQAAGLKALADLRGKRLMVLDNNRTSLARLWLDRALGEAGLPVAGEFFKTITVKDKVSTVVLPVFFAAADACLVTRRGFHVMTELNPQVGRQLREIAASPPLLPSLVCIRADYAMPTREVVLSAMRNAGNNPGSQQLFTVFQIGDLTERPLSSVDTTREFLAACERLQHTNRSPTPPASGAAAPDP